MDTQQKQNAHDVTVIEKSGQFDSDFYLANNPDVAKSGINPIAHYVYYGAREGRNPNSSFDTASYQLLHSVLPQRNPFAHFLTSENNQAAVESGGHSKIKSVDPKIKVILESEIFNIDYYLKRYPGCAKSAAYKAVDPELGPINHYLKHGSTEKQNPSEYFDTSFYLSHSKDVAAEKINPLMHYITHGWKELRNPTKGFDTAWYWITHLESDLSSICPLTHYIKFGEAENRSILPDTREKDAFDQNIEKAICTGAISKEIALSICTKLEAAKFSDSVEKILRHLSTTYKQDFSLKNELAKFYSSRGVWWQALELLQQIREINPDDSDILYRLAESYEKMNNLDKAAEAFNELTKIDDTKGIWHYRLGSIYRTQGKLNQAATAFKKAIARENDKTRRLLGVGFYDESRELWPEAANAYELRLTEHPTIAEIHYRLGNALKHCYRWDEAAAAYETAISLDSNDPNWYYYLGVALEKQGVYEKACQAYLEASAHNKTPMPEWLYRSGLCHHKAGQFQDACKTFLKVINIPCFTTIDAGHVSLTTNDNRTISDSFSLASSKIAGFKRITERYSARAEDYERLGDAYAELGLWQEASDSYRKAIARANKHQSELYYKLGASLTALGSYSCASEAFSWMYLFDSRIDVTKNQPHKNPRSLYAEYLKRPLLSKTIVYESYLGASLSCNPLAMYNALINDPRYSEWTHIWVVNETCHPPLELSLRSDTVFIKRQSDAYAKYLATASHLINNVTFPEWFIRREEQYYLNTWHGTPLKHMGHDVRDDFMAHKNISRNFLQCTHIINPNRYTTDLMLEKHEVNGVYSGLIAETGYPRVDALSNRSSQELIELRQQLDIFDEKPIVLYAPTWRGLHGNVQVDVERLKDDLHTMVDDTYHLIFRGHHFSEALVAGSSLPVIIAPHSFETCDLLAITDVLITDYSSIFFDYLSTKRPIVFYTYDIEEYTKSRGLYIGFEDLPGQVCLEASELKNKVLDLTNEQYVADHNHEEAVSKFAYLDDGFATKRAIDFFFEHDKTSTVSRFEHNKKSILLFPGSFIPNGITSSFLNLLNSLSLEKYSITLAIDPVAVSSYSERMDKYAKLPAGVHTLARLGSLVMDEQEAWVLRRFTQTRTLETQEMWDILQNLYKKEYHRLYGHTHFDTIINFEGYSFFWSSLFALGKPAHVSNVLYMHSDMHSEWLIRHPYLTGLFNIYGKYDALISVSEKMKGINHEKLSIPFDLPAEKFGYCINAINPVEIFNRSLDEVDHDILEWIDASEYMITLGRLSPEKDQAKLIDAVALVKKDFPSIKLVILGDGPLMSDLQRQVIDLDLSDNVLLAGLRENPFPLLSKSQCFVLSSNHEGQPMVLLESLALGKPIIATDIDGNRGVLNGGYGELVENSVVGLANGIEKFFKGEIQQRPFDAHAYMQQAVDMFAQNIMKADLNMEGTE